MEQYNDYKDVPSPLPEEKYHMKESVQELQIFHASYSCQSHDNPYKDQVPTQKSAIQIQPEIILISLNIFAYSN